MTSALKHPSHPLTFFIIFLIALTSCTFPASASDTLQVYVARPVSGDVIMLGERFDFLANGLSTAGDVSRVLFFANGSLVGEADNAAGETISTSVRWEPPAVGEYQLQVAAQRGSEYFYSETVTVCVLPFQIAPGHPTDIYAHGFEGECVIPARSPAAVAGSPEATTASASPNPLTYIPGYFESCREMTRFVNFKFYIDDPNDDVVFTSIAINLAQALMGRISGEATLALTRVGDEAPHTKLYAGRLDLHTYLERSFVDPASGEALPGDLIWSARAFGRDGSIVLEEGPFVIPVTPVGCDNLPLAPAAIETLLPEPLVTFEPQPTATPATAADCPPGTYFSDITNKCYQVALPTATPKENPSGGSQNTCSQYDSANACISAGCTYDYDSKSCK